MAVLNSSLILSLIDEVTAPARAIDARLKGLQNSAKANAQQMNEMRGQVVDAAGAAFALVKGLSGPITVAADFQAAMNNVAAVSGTTGTQFDELTAQAKELGRTTQFTASQAADAMGFLAMAGFDAQQIMEAMPGTLQLAASAQMDLGQAADIVSNILTGYGKDVSELTHVNDVLVKSFTSANTDLSQLGEALKYVGPIASSAGVSFEEAAAALSLMGNAGIQGSMAGTSLRGAISRILDATPKMAKAMRAAGLDFTDAEGRLLSLDEIVRQLEPHAADTGLFMELFGQRAGPAMAALVSQGADSLVDLTGELENSGGTAKRISDVQMAGFNGMMREMESAAEGIQIAFGNSLLPALEAAGKAFLAPMAAITGFIENNQRLVIILTSATAGLIAFRVATIATRFALLFMKGALLDVGIAGLSAISGIMSLLNPMNLVKNAAIAMRAALLFSGVGAIVIGLAMAGTWIYNNWSQVAAFFEGFGKGVMAAMAPVMPAIQPVLDWISSLVGWFGELLGPMDASSTEAYNLGSALGAITGQAIVDLITTIKELPGTIWDAAAAMLGAGAQIGSDIWNGIISKLATVGQDIADYITGTDWLAVGLSIGVAIWEGIQQILPNMVAGLGSALSDLNPFGGAVNSAVPIEQGARPGQRGPMPGYSAGGYTGNGPTNAVAGMVHGREFVMNASATARHGALLASLNAGIVPRIPSGLPSRSGSAPGIAGGQTINIGDIHLANPVNADPRTISRMLGEEVGRRMQTSFSDGAV